MKRIIQLFILIPERYNFNNATMHCRLSFLWVILNCLILGSCKPSQELFLPTDTHSWTQIGNATWTNHQGEWIGDVREGAGFLLFNDTFGDFTLELEFYPDSTINSGVFVCCRNQEINPTNCYEINIWDLHPIQTYRTGAIVTRANPLRNKKTIGKWNRYRISKEGKRLRVWLNGSLTADLKEGNLGDGQIAIQASGTGMIRFRNIRIRTFKGSRF